MEGAELVFNLDGRADCGGTKERLGYGGFVKPVDDWLGE